MNSFSANKRSIQRYGTRTSLMVTDDRYAQERKMSDDEETFLKQQVTIVRKEEQKQRFAVLTQRRILLYQSEKDFEQKEPALAVYPLFIAGIWPPEENVIKLIYQDSPQQVPNPEAKESSQDKDVRNYSFVTTKSLGFSSEEQATEFYSLMKQAKANLEKVLQSQRRVSVQANQNFLEKVWNYVVQFADQINCCKATSRESILSLKQSISFGGGRIYMDQICPTIPTKQSICYQSIEDPSIRQENQAYLSPSKFSSEEQKKFQETSMIRYEQVKSKDKFMNDSQSSNSNFELPDTTVTPYSPESLLAKVYSGGKNIQYEESEQSYLTENNDPNEGLLEFEVESYKKLLEEEDFDKNYVNDNIDTLIEFYAKLFQEVIPQIEQIMQEFYNPENILEDYDSQKMRQSFDFKSQNLCLRTYAPDEIFKVVQDFISQLETKQVPLEITQSFLQKVINEAENILEEAGRNLVDTVKNPENQETTKIQTAYFILANLLKNDFAAFIALHSRLKKQKPQYFGKNEEKVVNHNLYILRGELTEIDNLRFDSEHVLNEAS